MKNNEKLIKLFSNQIFSKFGLLTTPRIIIINQIIKKENSDEHSRRNSKEN